MVCSRGLVLCTFVWSLNVLTVQAGLLPNTYIVQLSDSSIIDTFHPTSLTQNYTIRHRYDSPGLFTGVSLSLADVDDEDLTSGLRQLPGVVSVFQVPTISPPRVAVVEASMADPTSPYEEYPTPPPMVPIVGTNTSDLASALQMAGVDKLHARGIKGKGMKIAFLDTGVDYRHPALGGGFGPGYKIAGGYSFMNDAGELANSTDPFADCLYDVGGHGTHVSGIAAMQRCANCTFDIEGVAPEASVYMYRIFGCGGNEVGLDTHFAAMLMAADEGVDVISMSIGDGDVNITSADNPFSATAAAIKDRGIAIFAAAANDAQSGSTSVNLRTVEFPGADPSIIAVGSVVNTLWPTMYAATDSNGNIFPYASIFPYNTTDMDVYIVDDPCSGDDWAALLPGKNLNTTVFVFEESVACNMADATSYWRELVEPQDVYAISYQGNWTTDPYLQSVGADTPGFLPDRNLAEFFQADGLRLVEQYTQAGGYPNYQISFSDKKTSSVSLPAGGMMDYYSSFGPVDIFPLKLKPQLSAPGGDILSTYPLGPGSGYAVSSGTSMSTPFAAASYLLVKSQLPQASVDEILARLQTTSKSVNWVYDTAVLSTTVQQGSGLINVFNAIFETTTISPGELNVGDATPSAPAKASITITNEGDVMKKYRLGHQGAAYTDQILNSTVSDDIELSQIAKYGSVKFESSTISVEAGKSTRVSFSISPPEEVDTDQLPIFSGFITVTDLTDRSAGILSVPYLARPYSVYEGPYFSQEIAGQVIVPGFVCSGGDSTLYPANGSISCNFTAGNEMNLLTQLSQYTTLYSIDILPANTTLVPTRWAPGASNTDADISIPPKTVPSSTLFGIYPSYGNIYNIDPMQGIHYAANPGSTIINDIGWTGSVTADNSSVIKLESGDYRLLISALRWGGNNSVVADYDTWLSGIITLS